MQTPLAQTSRVGWNQRIWVILLPILNWLPSCIPSSSHSSSICESQLPPPMDLSQIVQMSYSYASQGGTWGGKPPPGAHGMLWDAFQQPFETPNYPIHCTIYHCPLNINTKLQNNIHSLMGLHTMIQVSFTAHNVTIYSLIHFPLQFCIPHCIRSLFSHLETILLQSSPLAASLGPCGTIPRVTDPLDHLLLPHVLPNGH